MPKVDVIMPAYNAARYLPLSIESVIAQTFEDWKLTIVDDGSTDNTADVVAPFLDRLGPKIQYIQQPNSGPSAARNRAIRSSSSEFLAMLDADDIWLPCRLSESLKQFEGRPEVGLAYGFNSRIDLDGAIIDTFAVRQKHGEGRITPYIYMKMVDLPCATITVLRKAVEDAGMFDESLWATEDRDLWLRVSLKYEVALVPVIVSYYRTSPKSLTTNPDKMMAAQLRFIAKNYGLPGCGIRERRVALSRIYKQRAEAFGMRSQLGEALRSSMRSLAFYPFDTDNLRTAGSLLLRCAGINR